MKKKILFAGHNFSFLSPIIKYLEKDESCDIIFDKWTDHNKHNREISLNLLESSDIIFCEWCLGNAVWYSKHKKPEQKLIIRAHRQELTVSYMYDLINDNIDKFISITPALYQLFMQKIKLPEDKMEMIYNIIDEDKFIVNDNPERFNHIGFIGYVPSLKRMDLAIKLFAQIWEQNKSMFLHFKGKDPYSYDWLKTRKKEIDYYNRIYQSIKYLPYSNNIIFEPYGSDVSDFLSRMGYIISTSDLEGSHQSIAEGMAAGCIPVIRNWAGSDSVYPTRFIFNGIDSMRDFILLYGKKISRKGITKYAKLNFSLEANINKYMELLKN